MRGRGEELNLKQRVHFAVMTGKYTLRMGFGENYEEPIGQSTLARKPRFVASEPVSGLRRIQPDRDAEAKRGR